MYQLRHYLSAHHDFTTDEWQQIDAAFSPRTYAKGDFFVRGRPNGPAPVVYGKRYSAHLRRNR